MITMSFSKHILNACEIRSSFRSRDIHWSCLRPYSTTKKSDWKPVVGLEIHAQIKSASKLFSGAGTDFYTPTNRSVALLDAALPGTLPVLNRRCVEAGVLTALALSCDVNQVSTFDRKHYFYSDLPAGYQITQQRSPLARNGLLKFIVYKGGKDSRLYDKTSYIHQIQLEQDSGRSLHDDERSLVDLNRAGLPLMELVFKPDLSDGEEAASLVKELCLILTRLGTCSCKMEEGALRVDANVSVHKEGMPLGVRTEIKNIGSIRAVANAIDFEISRQIQSLNKGKQIVNETRSWDAESSKTVPMRDKEEKQDYRYMPEPNLPPLHLRVNSSQAMNANMVDVLNLQNKLPELPNELRQRFQNDFNLSRLQAVRLVNEDVLLSQFVEAMDEKKDRNAIILTDLLLNDVLAHLNERGNECFKVKDLGEITDMMHLGKINKSIARNILKELSVNSALTAEQIVKERGWTLITDPKEIESFCHSAMKEYDRVVKKHQAGKANGWKTLESKAWQISESRADMELVKEWFRKHLPYKGK